MAKMLTTADIGRLLDVKPSTVLKYRYRGTLPEPDDYVGRTPVWHPSTIDRFLVARPGRGAGGGPKPRRS
jgi:hypothetical protein